MGDFDSESSSSDGENAGEVKNVARLVMRPPGHSGKAKKGHLVFDASFEGGNLGRVDYVGELDYDLYVRPDVANLRHRVWFNFTVENVRADQRVVFTFVNFSKVLLLFHEGFTPVVKSTSRPQWVRIPSKCVFYYRCPEHANRYVLSIVFAFDKEEDVYHFAFSYPYSYSRLQKYLGGLEASDLPFLTREKIAETLHGRRLDLVTITTEHQPSEDANELNDPDPLRRKTKKKKKIVFVGARIHPGETPASYVCQGMMNFLVSDSPIARILRENLIFKFVPMLNPDGVYVGNYRTCILGQDLNRCWQETSTHAYPTLAAIKEVTGALTSEKDQEIDMYLDLHAHTGLLGTFVYGNSYTDVYRFQRHSLFPKHLSYCAPDFSLEHTAYNKDRNKQGTSRRFLSSFLDEKVNCYTLEVSFHGYEVPKGNSSTAIHVYDEAEYLRLGESICHSLLDYYCATKYIPPEEVPPSVRESCCKGSRANKLQQQQQQSSNQTSSPHHVAAASGMTGNVKKSATAKGKAAKTKPAATSKTSEEPHAQKPKVASAKNV